MDAYLISMCELVRAPSLLMTTLSDGHLDPHFQSLPGIAFSVSRHFGRMLTQFC
jgi:hypothetical protein